MVRVRLSDVSREMIQKKIGDCGLMLVGSSAMREMSEFPALMVEVNRGLMMKHRQSSDHARLVLAELGYLKIFSC